VSLPYNNSLLVEIGESRAALYCMAGWKATRRSQRRPPGDELEPNQCNFVCNGRGCPKIVPRPCPRRRPLHHLRHKSLKNSERKAHHPLREDPVNPCRIDPRSKSDRGVIRQRRRHHKDSQRIRRVPNPRGYGSTNMPPLDQWTLQWPPKR
jgi:hypothetical protein